MHACTQVYSSPLPPKITHLKVSKSHEMKGLLPGQSQSHGGGTELNCSLFSQKKQNPNKQKQVTVVGSHVCTTHVASRPATVVVGFVWGFGRILSSSRPSCSAPDLIHGRVRREPTAETTVVASSGSPAPPCAALHHWLDRTLSPHSQSCPGRWRIASSRRVS
jgi:hypothetical protein